MASFGYSDWSTDLIKHVLVYTVHDLMIATYYGTVGKSQGIDTTYTQYINRVLCTITISSLDYCTNKHDCTVRFGCALSVHIQCHVALTHPGGEITVHSLHD